jgi:hypothetical protein
MSRVAISLGLLLVAAGCRTLERAPALPEESSLVRDQLVIYSDFGLPKQHRLLDELALQRHDLSQRLQLPVTEEPIHVYLFSSPASFQDFMHRHHPEFPQRRAFFIETDTRLAVYAHWGDRVAEDLRHEVAHGYLHAAVPHLPLWLDEGLAEYFEVPRGHRGLNRPHVDMLLDEIARRAWRPNLRRLESLAAASDMSQLDYAESWAWIYFFLETDAARRALLQEYLQTLRKEGAAPPLSSALNRIAPDPDSALLEFVNSLRALPR